MKSTLKYGLVTGLISSIFLFGSFTLGVWLDNHLNWGMQAGSIQGVLGLISIPIQAIGIYLAMQDFKRSTGTLSYLQAVKTGLTVAITVAVILAFFSFLYGQFLNPGFREFMVKDAQKAMIAKGAGQQDLDQGLAQANKQFSTGSQVFMALTGQFFTGAIISLIIGLFIKTKKAA